jgi:hypothetical protein
MAAQDFNVIAAGDDSLLREVEAIVVDSHRQLYLSEGKRWSKPVAYRWIRYEDSMPVQRLAEAVEKLEEMGATFDREAVDKACTEAAGTGFSS